MLMDSTLSAPALTTPRDCPTEAINPMFSPEKPKRN